MDTENIRAAIIGYFQPAFLAEHPTVKLVYDNNPTAQPVRQPWVYVSVFDNETGRANIGSDRQFKTCGAITCQVMVPENTGTKTLKEIADTVATLLIDRRISVPGQGSLTTYGVRRRDRGIVNGWKSYSIQCEYRHWHQSS